jgi:hypothetical protein
MAAANNSRLIAFLLDEVLHSFLSGQRKIGMVPVWHHTIPAEPRDSRFRSNIILPPALPYDWRGVPVCSESENSVPAITRDHNDFPRGHLLNAIAASQGNFWIGIEGLIDPALNLCNSCRNRCV